MPYSLSVTSNLSETCGLSMTSDLPVTSGLSVTFDLSALTFFAQPKMHALFSNNILDNLYKYCKA